MDWTVTDWPAQAGKALPTVAVFNEFISAIRERQAILGQSPLLSLIASPPPSPAYSAGVVAALQQWIETNLTAFVQSHTAGARYPTTQYDAAASIPVYSGLDDLLTRVGAGAVVGGVRTWRRYRDLSGANLGGQCQSADLILTCIFSDLMKAVNGLIWTRQLEGGSLWANAENWNGFGSGYISWPAAQAIAVATYALNGPGGIIWTYAGGGSAGDNADPMRAQLMMRLSRALVNLPAGCPAVAVDWHVYPRVFFPTNAVFDPLGELDATGNPLAQTAWQRWRTQAFSANAALYHSADTLPGNHAQPPWCGDPTASAACRGFGIQSLGDTRALLRWDVDGGLVYVA